MRGFLAVQTRLVDQAIHALVTGSGIGDRENLAASDEVARTVALMMQGMGSSCHSIIRLSEELGLSLRDCLGIARSVSETAINIAYILAGGEELARRAQRHAMQKAYRDLRRDGQIGGTRIEVRWSGTPPDPSAIPELKASLDEFTDRRGNEKRDWTDDNLDHRVRKIEAKYGKTSLNFATSAFAIYRHSSEILHGTYYGCLYFLTCGMEKPASRQEAEYRFLTNHLVSIFTATYFSVNGVIEVIANEFAASNLREKNELLFKKVHAYFEGPFSAVESPTIPKE